MRANGQSDIDAINPAELDRCGLIYAFSKATLTAPPGYTGEEMGGRVDFILNLASCRIIDRTTGKNDKLKVWKTDLVDARIEYLSMCCGTMSRYKSDKRLPDNIYRTLYIEWARNAGADANSELLLGSYGYGSARNKPKSILVLRHFDKFSRIDLIGVSKCSRKKGLGSSLLEEGISRAKINGSNRLLVSTQAVNEGACAFYSRHGFTVVEKSFVYHFHKRT